MKHLITLSLLATILLLFNSCEQEEQLPGYLHESSITQKAQEMIDKAKSEGTNIDSQCELSAVYAIFPTAGDIYGAVEYDLEDGQGKDSVAIIGEIRVEDPNGTGNGGGVIYGGIPTLLQDRVVMSYMLYDHDVENRQKKRSVFNRFGKVIKMVENEYWENENIKRQIELIPVDSFLFQSVETIYDEHGSKIEQVFKTKTDEVNGHSETFNRYENGLLMETVTYDLINDGVISNSKNEYSNGILYKTIDETYKFSQYSETLYYYDNSGRIINIVCTKENRGFNGEIIKRTRVTTFYYNLNGILLYELHDNISEDDYDDEYLFYEYNCN